MKKSFLWIALLSASQVALAQVQGVVRDEQGQPIEGAVVDVVGSKLKATTNKQGEFSFPQLTEGHVELHVKAPRFTHETVHVHPGDSPVELVLASTSLEIVNVIGLPWHASTMESAQPINVLTGDKLRNRQASTLGETLKHEVGVHSSYYGSVASSPIIRGLEGPRVLIAQNGLDAGDASRVGPDHAVATEASTARQVEILRGPATLFYGSGAIGGVVNIVDDRVPQNTDTYGEWRIQQDSVADDKLVSASGNTGVGNVGLHLDGFWRDAEDYKIPGPAELHHDEEEEHEEEHQSKRLANSFTEAKGINLGASVMVDAGFVGVSYGRLERQYGIPGHSHDDEEDVNIYADLTQDRVQLISELSFDDDPVFSAMNVRLGFTDYEHSEIEAGEPVTTFTNATREARWDLFHHPIAEWRGAVSLHAKTSDFEAIGEEAFTPPSTTDTLALALMEERHFGDLLVQLGARIEQVTIEANNWVVDLNHHDHDGEEHEGEYLSVFSIDHESMPFSASAGLVWDFTDGYNIGFSYTHAERTPSAAELLSFGPHLGSGLYEVGSLLRLVEDEPGEVHFDLARTDLELETSNNLDISLRKFEGDLGFVLNAFYNRIDNYYYLADTGLTDESAHNHGEEEHEHEGDEHTNVLPVFIYQAQDAELYGVESEIIWQASAPLKLSLTSDYIRAQLKDGGDLPRIPPLRIGARAEYELGNWSGEISTQHYFEQDKIDTLETTTDSYTLLDAQITYAFNDGLKIYLKGNNLTGEYARVHASFLKDKAPLPARSFALGITGSF